MKRILLLLIVVAGSFTILNSKALAVGVLRPKMVLGTVQSKGQASLVVKNDGGETFTVNINSSTRFARRFGGKSSFSEVSMNDKVRVFGRVADGTDGKTLLAKLIWDSSIQKRHSAFWSKVTSVSGNTIVVETCKRETQTVTVDSATKVKKADNTVGSISDIKVGSFGIFMGLWDNKANTLDAREAEKGKVVLREKIGCFNSTDSSR